MKILHVAKISDNKLNGVNAVVPEYVRYQSRIAEVKFMNYNKISINGLSEWQVEFDNLENILEILKLQDFIPDIVVIHEVNNVENIKLYKTLKKANIPYVIVPHGEITKTALKKKWLKKKIAYFIWFNKFIKNAEAIQCLSENEMINIEFKKEKFVATNGVNLPDKFKSYFNEQTTQMVYIGRLDCMHKGLDLLLSGINGISDFCRYNNVKLAIYGPDILDRKKILKGLISKFNLEDIVSLHNPVCGQDKVEALLKNDIFIQTSRFEGMPLGILEAMSFGLPCIITKGTNLVEDVCEFEAGYDAGTTDQTIADTIKFAVNDRENWKNKGAQAVKLVSEKYNWDIVSRETIDNYLKFIRS